MSQLSTILDWQWSAVLKSEGFNELVEKLHQTGESKNLQLVALGEQRDDRTLYAQVADI